MIDDLLRDLLKDLKVDSSCSHHGVLTPCKSPDDCDRWVKVISSCSPEKRIQHLRWFAVNDLYFLLVVILNQKNVAGYLPSGEISERMRKWYFDRCGEVMAKPNNVLRFWSRGTGKTTIVTYGKTIQDVLSNPNISIGIFSHTRPIAKSFLNQIKREFEMNDLLKSLFPDILWTEPRKEAPKWSEDQGLIVKRNVNRREPTIEAYGLIDGMPTSRHYSILVYDDVISDRAVTSPEMIQKVTEKFELSLQLAETKPPVIRVQGVFFDPSDTYQTMIERGTWDVEIRPAVTNDESLFWDPEGLADMRRAMSSKTWASQILLNMSKANEESGFDPDWIQYGDSMPSRSSLNVYIFVDPAARMSQSESYTSMWVLGLGADRHIYVLDMIRDRLTLTQRGDALFELVQKWGPLCVFYERYGFQSDIEYLMDRQNRQAFRFRLEEVGAGSALDKNTRIYKLEPLFREKRIVFPRSIVRRIHTGEEVNLVEWFVKNEYRQFPFGKYKDCLDCLARVTDSKAQLIMVYPRAYSVYGENDRWRRIMLDQWDGGSWMSS